MADEGAWDELEGRHEDDDWDGDCSDDAPDNAKADIAGDALLREYKAKANAAAFRIVMNAFMDARDAHKAGEKWWFEPMHPEFEGLITDAVAHAGDLERRLQEEASAEARKLKLANKHKKDKERKRAQRATEAVGSSSETDDVNLGALASGGTSCAASSGGENSKSSPSNPPTTSVLVKQPLPAATRPTGQ